MEGGDVSELASASERIQQIAGQENVQLLGTEIGSMTYVVRPGDGSAHEQAMSYQRVIGSLTNVAQEYAAKRYRFNVINWGMLPLQMVEQPSSEVRDYIYIPGTRRALDECSRGIEVYVFHDDGETNEIRVRMESLAAEEHEIIKAGSLINFNRSRLV